MINNLDLESLKKYFLGKKVLIRSDLHTRPTGVCERVSITSSMANLSGQVVEIDYVDKSGFLMYSIFHCKESESYWEFDAIDSIVEEVDINITEQVELEIKKGDLVRIKNIKNNEEKENICGYLFGIPIIKRVIKKEYIEAPKDEFVVADIIDNVIYPYYFNNKYNNIVITKDMVELVKEGYLDKVKNKKRKLAKEVKMLEDLETMEEMKSKVNTKDFKKIYASTLRAKPNDLKGLDLLLHQWAFNKKHIYKMFDNKLSISKEIEYVKSGEDVRTELESLYRQFPVALYVLRNISNDEIINNLLNSDYDGYDWQDYSSTYCYQRGTKVSKLLKEACNNDKLDIAFSDIIAQNKIRGIIEISIDPIEILLMSTNVSGWQSCHRITSIGHTKDWGQYSGGIFSYMCDNVSMIAFRHNNKLYDFNIYKSKTQQHSKNWRQMIWINEDFTQFVTSRQYPGKMEGITKEIREMLEEQINNYKGEFTWVHSDNMDKIKKILKDYKYNNNSTNIMHYNDMLNGYSGDLCYKKDTEIIKDSIIVGSNPVCTLCGKNIMLKNRYPFCIDCKKIVDNL